MNSIKKTVGILMSIFISFFITACSVFGKDSVEIAPYTVLLSDDIFEIRHYPKLVLVSTPMQSMDGQSQSFRKLFNYIDGNNDQNAEISMTAPVFLDQEQQQSTVMSFVLPASYDLAIAPKPNDSSVTMDTKFDLIFATVRFNGRLTQSRINQFEKELRSWIDTSSYEIIGSAQAAGYNSPFTLPAYRRNEVLIPVQKR